MRRLQDFQTVTLTFGDTSTTATVSSVDRGVAQLDAPTCQLVEGLAFPVQTELSFVHQGHYVMLSGTLARDGHRWLTFIPRPQGQIPSRRTGPRLQLQVPARVTLPAGETVLTSSVDVSTSGVLLAHARLGRPLDVVRLALTLPAELGTVESDARIIRIGWNETALRFSGMPAEDTARIKALVEDVRFTLAQRFGAQRAAG